MSIFDIYTASAPNNWTHLKHDMCSCDDCDWSGPVSSCRTETEQETWEMPPYTFHICPICELGGEIGCIASYYSSIEAVFETAFEDCVDKQVTKD